MRVRIAEEEGVALPSARATATPVGRPAHRSNLPARPASFVPFKLSDHLLIIGDLFRRNGLQDIDYAEAMDAAHEDRWGRLPHEPGYGRPPLIAVPSTPAEIEDIAA